jgi:NSS family neurotransmitter:Na+ symporter
MDPTPGGTAVATNNETAAARGTFGSRFGFILACAGSAIGLGNIWRFPYMAGQGGGSAFVLVYLGCVVLVGVPVMLAEMSMGRASRKNPVGAFRALVPSRWWPWVGGLGVLAGFGILAFYSVVAGWTLGYAWFALTGRFAGHVPADESGALFTGFIADPVAQLALTGLFILLTALIVRGGIAAGIERASKILMPLLFVVLIALAIRALTLPGAGQGVSFLFSPDFSKITPRVVMGALGQALFSLSLGMGAMITYASYLKGDEDLPTAAFSVAFFDTAVALAAGLVVFPALFTAGVPPDKGPGLVFVVLPTIFGTLPGLPSLFAFAFYVLLAIAALTSTISLLEVVVAFLVDEWHFQRERAVWVSSAACFVLAIPSALSLGAVPWLTTLLGPAGGFLDLQNILWGNFALTVGALGISLFVGWRWGTTHAVAELAKGVPRFRGAPVFGFLIRFLCPVAVAVVLLFIALTGQYY